VVGDKGIGRMCMLLSYVDDTFPENYVPTVFDNREMLQVVDDKKVRLQFFRFLLRLYLIFSKGKKNLID
jgi:GTPase SAR1 family protein